MQNLSNWWSLFWLGFLQELFDNVIGSFGLSSSLSFQAKKKYQREDFREECDSNLKLHSPWTMIHY